MDHLQTLLQRLTGRRTVPNLLLDFESIGGSDEVALLHGEGGLQRKFEEMGVLPGFRSRFSPNRGINIRKDPILNEMPIAAAPPPRAQPEAPQQIPPHAQPLVPQLEPVLPQQPPPGREEQALDHDDIRQRHGAAGPAVDRIELDRKAVAHRHADVAAPAEVHNDDSLYGARNDQKHVPLDDASDTELYVAAGPKPKVKRIQEVEVEESAIDEEELAQLQRLRRRLAELEALAAGKIHRVSGN
jgi:hypothetical protein